MSQRSSEFLFGLRNRHLFLLDVLLWFLTAAFALWLRTEESIGQSSFSAALVLYVLLACIVRLIVFRPFGLYSRYWRYASVDELLQIAFAAFLAMALLTVIFWWFVPLANLLTPGLPRSIPLIDGILVFIATSGLRFSIRLAERFRQKRVNAKSKQSRVAIFGAGDAGIMLAREMQKNPQLGLQPVVFLDADPRKQGSQILDVPVVGDRRRLPEVIKEYGIQQAIIAIPSAPGKVIRELTQLCHAIDLPVKTMPGLSELLNGKLAVSQIRPVEITDLLRREPVEIEMNETARLLQDKRVLVTGAGGSIGSELCRQIARCAPAEMILLGHGENSIFDIANELGRTFSLTPDPSPLAPRPVLADIRDRDRLGAIFKRDRPQIVFHAAAHKHVPLMEENVEEAVTNNILGTRNLIECALEANVAHFVLISTDKAVNPTSVMGATKRVAEMLVQSAARRTDKHFVAVRFGNVLDSRGSVVPTFKKQIAQGGPITITHPEIRRFFMTIPEAVQLVLRTTVLAKSGAIYILDMGEPVKIVDLANDLIRLSGFEPDEIEIKFTGLRPGEKLYEELFISGEEYQRTAHNKIFVTRNGAANPTSNLQLPISNFQPAVDALIAAAQRGEPEHARQLLREIVPEYQPGGAASFPGESRNA